MELQHVNVKLLLKDPQGLDLEPLIPVLHRWIQEKTFEERLLDIADYRHVPEGPGVILIGLEADYSVDNTGGRMGVRYNRKAELDGGNRGRLRQATRAALSACRQLQNEPGLDGKLQFNGQDVELFINDRVLAPNNEATRSAAEPEIRAFLDEMFRGGYSLSYPPDPRRLFGVSVKAARAYSVEELLQNLPA